MFAKFILVLSLFTGLSASALPDGDGCEESLEVSPSLIQIAKKAALAQFNSSEMTVMRYVDSQVVNKVTKGKDGTLTFDVDVIFGYQPGKSDRKKNFIIELDKDGNSLDEVTDDVRVDPKLMQAAKEAALAKFNSSPLLVMRYVDGQIVKSIVKNDNGSYTFVVDILFNYGSTETQTDTQTVTLDEDGNSLDEINFFGTTVTPFIRATKKPKVRSAATETADIKQAVREFIASESPHPAIASMLLYPLRDEATGERRFLASVKVHVTVQSPGSRLHAYKGTRLQNYNVVVSHDGAISVANADVENGEGETKTTKHEQVRVENALREFIEAQTPGRLVTGLDLEMTENKSTGEHNYFASVKVRMPPLGDRTQFYNIVVLSDGRISITASGGQG